METHREARMSAISDAAQSAQTKRGEEKKAFGGNCHDSFETHAGCHARIVV